jgi:hypothetical protein
MAQDWPMTGGDYWDVTAITIKDGGGLKYADWLADEWRKINEFAKSKGWIKEYFVLSNTYPRKGEPDLYLVQVFESMPSGPEGEKRGEEFREWRKKSVADMVEESGNRAEFREVTSSSLLQVLNFRD